MLSLQDAKSGIFIYKPKDQTCTFHFHLVFAFFVSFVFLLKFIFSLCDYL